MPRIRRPFLRRPFLRRPFPRRTVLAAALALVTGQALAQATMTEEQDRRQKVLETTSPSAAKVLFGRATSAAPLEARAIGNYAKGCLAGAAALPVDGETWQVMRLTRNRNWGHPELITILERLSKRAPQVAGWPGLLVGDISQPRGGPMLTGHASHQVGLDADVWLTPMPNRRLSSQEREEMSAVNMARPDWMDVDPAVWTPGHTAMVKAAANERRVERIFVNPALKKALCREAGSDRAWLSKVRPMWGHNYHFHIRLSCPAGAEDCGGQEPPAGGEGCGQELDDWLAQQHRAIFAPKKPAPASKPKPPMTLDALPAACRQVLVAR